MFALIPRAWKGHYRHYDVDRELLSSPNRAVGLARRLSGSDTRKSDESGLLSITPWILVFPKKSTEHAVEAADYNITDLTQLQP